MKLRDLIKQSRTIDKPLNNTEELAKKLDPKPAPKPPTSDKKSLNQEAKDTMEVAQSPSPYMKDSPTLMSPSPTEENSSLREHIKRYRKEMVKPEMGKLDKGRVL